MTLSRSGGSGLPDLDSCTIRFSTRRRYPAVVVHPDLRVEVVVPPGTPQTAIEDLYRRKSPWVVRTLARFRESPCRAPERRYVTGEIILLAGEELRLVVETGRGRAVFADDASLRVVLPAGASRDDVRSGVIEFYREEAARRLGPLVEVHAARIGVPCPPFRVKLLRRRWGSCSRAGRLNFNLRLAMAPPALMEYIVVHELCHLLHLDHSPAFWRAVARYLPDYPARRRTLRETGWQYSL